MKPPRMIFPGHSAHCAYPGLPCVCGTIKHDEPEAARRQRMRDMDAIARGRVVVHRKPQDVKNAKGEVVAHELVNPRRRDLRAYQREKGLSPRQMKKLRKAAKRELKARQLRQQQLAQAVTASQVGQADVPAGMQRTPSGLLVPTGGA